jgi:hypothetical protein
VTVCDKAQWLLKITILLCVIQWAVCIGWRVITVKLAAGVVTPVVTDLFVVRVINWSSDQVNKLPVKSQSLVGGVPDDGG